MCGSNKLLHRQEQEMKSLILKSVIGMAAATCAASVFARDHVSVSLSIGAPVYTPAPVYVTPPPVVYTPAPVVYQPVVPVVSYERVYYGPPGYWHEHHHHHGYRH
jgi:hypothetical protein